MASSILFQLVMFSGYSQDSGGEEISLTPILIVPKHFHKGLFIQK